MEAKFQEEASRGAWVSAHLVSTQTHLHLPIKVKSMKKRAETRFWVYAGIITETKEESEVTTH